MSLTAKLVIVLAAGLPPGEAANAASVLALAAAAAGSDLGAEGVDAAGRRYGRIDRRPVPVLAADQAQLTALHDRAANTDDLHVVAFTEVARRSRDYEAYIAELAQTSGDNPYVGLLVSGPRNRVTAATKRLPLYGADARPIAAGTR